MSNQLKQNVREHIESFSLSDEQLKKLQQLDSNAGPASVGYMPVFRWSLAGAVAAFFLVFVLTTLFVGQGDIREQIALEVAANHIKLKPLDVEATSINGVRDYFTKLDFVPVDSKLVNKSGLALIGGRYCSLQGITAAQLRFKEPGSNSVQTLYQTEYRKDVFSNMPLLEEGDEPAEIYVKGIKVKIWVEKGLLFALTESPDA